MTHVTGVDIEQPTYDAVIKKTFTKIDRCPSRRNRDNLLIKVEKVLVCVSVPESTVCYRRECMDMCWSCVISRDADVIIIVTIVKTSKRVCTRTLYTSYIHYWISENNCVKFEITDLCNILHLVWFHSWRKRSKHQRYEHPPLTFNHITEWILVPLIFV